MANREMTRKNKKLLKEQKYVSEEENQIKRFVIILLSLIVIIVAIYFITTTFVKKESTGTDSNEVQAGEIDYNVVTVGTMLNREESEYYVLVYDQDKSSSSIYATYGGLYTAKEDAIKMYYCNLNNELNKSYVATDGNTNPHAKKIEDFKFGEITLIKVKKQKVVKYLEDVDTIKKELGI